MLWSGSWQHVATLLAAPNALAAAEQSDNENRNSDDQPSWKRGNRNASPNQQQKATKRDAKAITDARSDHFAATKRTHDALDLHVRPLLQENAYA